MIFLNKRKFFNGRTMLEMIGVLAIIGILSIGILVAYQRAMVSKKTNEIIEYVSMLSLDVARKSVNKPVSTTQCSNYNSTQLQVPPYFSTCTVGFNKNNGTIINVTYEGEAEDLITSLENRKTSNICISIGATRFTVGGKNRCD